MRRQRTSKTRPRTPCKINLRTFLEGRGLLRFPLCRSEGLRNTRYNNIVFTGRFSLEQRKAGCASRAVPFWRNMLIFLPPTPFCVVFGNVLGMFGRCLSLAGMCFDMLLDMSLGMLCVWAILGIPFGHVLRQFWFACGRARCICRFFNKKGPRLRAVRCPFGQPLTPPRAFFHFDGIDPLPPLPLEVFELLGTEKWLIRRRHAMSEYETCATRGVFFLTRACHLVGWGDTMQASHDLFCFKQI